MKLLKYLTLIPIIFVSGCINEETNNLITRSVIVVSTVEYIDGDEMKARHIQFIAEKALDYIQQNTNNDKIILSDLSDYVISIIEWDSIDNIYSRMLLANLLTVIETYLEGVYGGDSKTITISNQRELVSLLLTIIETTKQYP